MKFWSIRFGLINFLFLVMTSFSPNEVLAQIPSAPNALNQNGEKDGKWIFILDHEYMPVADTASPMYFREVIFENGQIVNSAREYYIDGTLQWEGFLSHNFPDTIYGLNTWYYPSGQVMQVGEYLDSKLQDTLKIYYENGQLSQIVPYESGVAKDTAKSYYDDGTLKETFPYKDGAIQGLYRSYDSLGTITSEISYENGKAKGYFRKFYPSGLLKEEYDVQDDQLNGGFISYFENGLISWAGAYKDGKANGEYQDFDELGNLTYHYNYREDSLDGRYLKYYPSGQVEIEQFYLLGVLDSSYSAFYENGTPQISGQYTEGERDGKWVWYFDDGRIDDVIFYDKGEEKSFAHYFPRNINKLNAGGKRDSLWIFMLNDDYETETDSVEATAYRHVYYDDGQILKFEEYYGDGQLVTIGDLLSVEPLKPKSFYLSLENEGDTSFYYTYDDGEITKTINYENGIKIKEGYYQKGELISEITYNNGLIKERWTFGKTLTTNEEFREDGTLAVVNTQKPNGDIEHTYEYWEDGQTLKTASKFLEWETVFNRRGEPIKHINYLTKGLEETFELDSNNNIYYLKELKGGEFLSVIYDRNTTVVEKGRLDSSKRRIGEWEYVGGGNKRSKVNYRNGAGIVSARQKAIPKSPNNYKNKFFRHGSWTLYFDINGRSTLELAEANSYALVNYDQGSINHAVKIFDLDHRQIREVWLNSPNEFHGRYIEFDSTGRKTLEGSYLENKKDSVWHSYDSTGIIIKSELFDEGELIADITSGLEYKRAQEQAARFIARKQWDVAVKQLLIVHHGYPKDQRESYEFCYWTNWLGLAFQETDRNNKSIEYLEVAKQVAQKFNFFDQLLVSENGLSSFEEDNLENLVETEEFISLPFEQKFELLIRKATWFHNKLNVDQAWTLIKKTETLLTDNPDPGAWRRIRLLELKATFFKYDDKPEEAKKIYDEIFKIYRDSVSIRFAKLTTDYASVLARLGEWDKAEKHFLAVFNAISPEEDPSQFAEVAAALGDFYFNQSRNDLSYNYYNQALATIKSFNVQKSKEALILTNQALTLSYLGDHTKAEQFVNMALDMVESELGKDSHQYYEYSNTKASILVDIGQFEEAERIYGEIFEYYEENTPYSVQSIALTINNRGVCLGALNRNSEALQMYISAYDIMKDLGVDLKDLITMARNIGFVNMEEDQKEEAMIWYKKAFDMAEELPDDNPARIDIKEKYAELLWKNGDVTEAKELLFSIGNDVLDLFYEVLPNLTSRLRKPNYQAYQKTLAKITSAFAQEVTNDPSKTTLFYNHWISSKGAAFRMALEDRKFYRQYPEDTVRHLYNEVLNLRHEAIQLQNKSGLESRVESLLDLADSYEEWLLSYTKRKANTLGLRYDWSDISNVLKQDEAVLEFISYRHYEGHFTDSVRYGAFVIRQNKEPIYIDLGSGSILENNTFQRLSTYIQFQVTDEESYKELWSPVERHLDGASKIYVVQDGIYNRINLNTIYNPVTNSYLIDQYEFNYILNSYVLLDSSQEKFINFNVNKDVVIVGNPDFSVPLIDHPAYENNISEETENLYNLSRTRASSGTFLSPLPGTASETNLIHSLANLASMETQLYQGPHAHEENIKAIESPAIIHIATHGFFDSEENLEHANSGLYLAGASDALNFPDFYDESLEDGILYSGESMYLDLEKTWLVTLSACETGLGALKPGESVKGLQQSFFLAGTRNLINSLWKVDDEATKQLMSEFYSQLFITRDIHRAFRNAQLLTKSKFKNPKFWGSFVLIGG